MSHPLRGLYAITDSQLLPGEQLFSAVAAALRGGARVIQYRDKSDDRQRRLAQSRALARLCADYGRPLLINDDVELARASGAQGVHLGQGDGDPGAARQTLGLSAIIGVTCHADLNLALAAQRAGADYVAFGAFFPSATKPGASPAPLELLAEARRALQVPVVAIGGISVDNATQVIEQGASMVAAIHSLFASDDVEQRARAFQRLFASNRQPPEPAPTPPR
ncbi:thiamine phosphate synthase [Motiliproteus sp. SC1-56]|uniref:thiamine phosphate synthase n=1 Tax=Motiliproteus sp. SC1-56 TaxID=2799565 RepID=UPI001A8C40CE|nr:thiamine phosphate synthase [Motiliproteus sp. SC1-56]